MQLDLSSIIKQLQSSQKKFNSSNSSTEKYSILQSINHLAEHSLKFKDDHWIMRDHRIGMLREQGIDIH